jgi:DDE superfamily endonuclease
MWCVAELNDDYIERMEDVLALYERPYRADEPVVCLDEKPVSLHADVRPSRPMKPGRPTQRDNEYKRCGTANIFAVVEPKTGRHFNRATANRKAPQFAQVIAAIVAAYPAARKIHLVMDNLNIHCQKSLTSTFGQLAGTLIWQRLQVHHTPKHGSWLNQAEIELSLVSRQCLGHRRIPDLQTLQTELNSWNEQANRNQIRIQWRFTRKAARAKFGYDKTVITRSRN